MAEKNQGPPPAYNYQDPGKKAYPTQDGAPSAPGYLGQNVTHGTFDSGARFDNAATKNIPPPPPGVMPNLAQQAAAQGQPVIMTQNKSNFEEGSGSGSGYTVM